MDKTGNQKGDYGIDAPGVIRNLALIGIVLLLLCMGTFFAFAGAWRWIGTIPFLLGLICLIEAVYMIWSSKVGKYYEREKLLDLVPWRGDEKVLDIGCGRGLVLNAAAKRLDRGKAIGIDIWNERDQSGNHPDVTLENAEREGVRERVEVVSADARDIPFSDNEFDVIVSSLALHNIYDKDERRKALGEIFRVLKPGGHFAILDFRHVDEYAAIFEELGATGVQIAGPHYFIFPPVRIVVGRKP
jgi:SAM-dependent methyltransferase